ncbi:MAG: phosphoribosylformylglycinamidine synthase subunit PurL [bacterium]
MVYRVEVAQKKENRDVTGDVLKKRIENDLEIKDVKSIRILKTYLFDIKDVTEKQIRNFAEEVLCDPISEIYEIGPNLADSYTWEWMIDTGFLPGVTDNEARTARWAMGTYFGMKFHSCKIFSGKKYLISGSISEKKAENIKNDLLINKLIQYGNTIHTDEWEEKKREDEYLPEVKESSEVRTEAIDFPENDTELMELSKKRTLALNLGEMKTIREHFSDQSFISVRKKRGFPSKITDCELEVLAQTWSEHCKHKIFAAHIDYIDEINNIREDIDSLFRSFITSVTKELMPEKPWVKSVFHDNAGVVQVDEDTLLAMKVETHNSPSALDPYGGALTGIVGVNRDILGCGKAAKPIFNTDVFCFASPFYKGELPGKNLMHPSRIMRGVHAGVRDGGNESGIPVVNGSMFFDNRYIGKPLVFCGTGGIMPLSINNTPSWEKKAEKGDIIVMTGGRVGKDGIHGATFSSEELHEGSPATAVQIGDPITQKKMLDFIIEARDKNLYSAITDNGAGGLSSSVGEMAEDTNGAKVNLEKVPLKYRGLQPWEIFISEAQERMTLAVPRKNMEALKKIAAVHEVEISEIGEFTDSGYLEIFHSDNPVALLDMNFLHNGLPQYKLKAVWNKKENTEYDLPEYEKLNDIMLDMISRLNIASKEEWVRQYDHEVQGRTAGKPFTGVREDGPADAAVLRIHPSKDTAVVVSHGIKPTFSDIDTYWMTASVIDEAVRNAVCVGADPDFMSGLDNFCWPDPVYHPKKNPDGKEKLALLVRSNKGLYDFCKAYRIPLISGKDSMKNDYGSGKNKISVPPTLLFTLISKMKNVKKMVSMYFKNPGDSVYVLGETREELGGSEYMIYHGRPKRGKVPRVEAEKFFKAYRALHRAISAGTVNSAHDLSDGGLGVAVAESAMAGDYGVDISLKNLPRKDVERDDFLLFSESNGRILISVPQGKEAEFEKIISGPESDIIYARIGEVTESKFVRIRGTNEEPVVELTAEELKTWWQKPMNQLK